ncbi:MAG TPA: VWA domain-containing protein [Acidobacteriaceae bacterium]|nr:VWA domain-containing protein [Acidobacteriaceae bacterium]
MKTSRRYLQAFAFAFIPFLFSSLFGQSGASGKSLQSASATQANKPSVLLAVTVRDKKHGDLVPNLAQSDFTLSVDNKPQAIQTFEPSSSLPLTLGLLVDTSTGERAALSDERAAVGRFIDQMLSTPQQRAFLIQFAHEVDLLADDSTNKAALQTALNQLGQPQSHDTTADQADSGERHMNSGGGDNLYDAIYLASDQLMKQRPDRKVLVVLTNGIDSGSKETLFSAIETAQRANTIVYAVYFKGEEQRGTNHNGFPGQRRGGMGYPGGGYPGGGYPGGGGGWPGGGGNRQPAGRPTEGSRTDGRKILEQICSETGGRMFEVSHKMTFDQALAAIAQELHAQYILGFTPPKSDSYSGYRRIDLTTDKKDLIVQTRQGYYSGNE